MSLPIRLLVLPALLLSSTAHGLCGGGGTSALPAPPASYLRAYRAPFGVPSRVAATPSGNLYIVDSALNEIVVRAANGRVLSRTKPVARPTSVAVAGNDTIYVGDAATGSVTAFDAAWQQLFQCGRGAGELGLPNDIAIEAVTGNLYIVDSAAHSVKVYAAGGAPLFAFGGQGSGDGQFNVPVAVAVDAATRQVLVVDQLNYRVETFAADGTFLSCFGAQGNSAGKFNMPQGIALDAQGRVYVADSVEGRVEVLDRNGDFVSYLGDFGDAPGQLRIPVSLAIDSSNRLFIAAANNARLEVFSLGTFTDPESVAPAVAQIAPDPIERATPPPVVAAYIEVPGYSPDQIDPSTITANGIHASATVTSGDHDNNGVADLRVEFDTAQLLTTLPAQGAATVQLTGSIGAMHFEGSTALQVTICGPGTLCPLGDADPQCSEAVCLVPSGCTVRAKADGGGCEDGDACTIEDTCSAGVCVGRALHCDDGNVCTDDSCDAPNGCVFSPNTAACDDANACTSGDTCGGGVCTGAALDCNDNNTCTDDSCAPASGCLHADNISPCDDGSACTLGDTCGSGICGGAPRDCNDSNDCTDDGCNPTSGCAHGNNSAACDDGNACTVGDTCGDGTCRGAARDCNDANDCTDDSCNPASGCARGNNSAACDDGNACTLGDNCAGGVCRGALRDCNDGNDCTDDICDSAGTCGHPFSTKPCDDLDAATVGDTCNGAGSCRGRFVTANYALLRWPLPTHVRRTTKLGSDTIVLGEICVEELKLGLFARVDGNLTAWADSGRAVAFRHGSSTSGDASTGGGSVSGIEATSVSGRVDTTGNSVALSECVAARTLATRRLAQLAGLAPRPDLILGTLTLGRAASRRLPAAGSLGGGQVVVDLNNLILGPGSRLTLAGDGGTDTVIVRVHGRLILGSAARIDTEGLSPERVLFVVDQSAALKRESAVTGSIVASRRIHVGRAAAIHGALLGEAIDLAPSSTVDLHGFVGWVAP